MLFRILVGSVKGEELVSQFLYPRKCLVLLLSQSGKFCFLKSDFGKYRLSMHQCA